MRRRAVAAGRLEHGGERRAMGVEPAAERRRGLQRAQRAERRRAVAREALGRGAPRLADRAHGGMGVAVFGCCPSRLERGVEIVERGDRRGAEDADLERPRRRVLLGAAAAEARRGMGDQRLDRERAEFEGRLQDEPRQGARLGLAEGASGRILDLYAPAREFGRNPAGDRTDRG